ncbi:hypothetical protein [Lacunimicrobium album]
MSDSPPADEMSSSESFHKPSGTSLVLRLIIVYGVGLTLIASLLGAIWYQRFGPQALPLVELALLVCIATMTINRINGLVASRTLEPHLVHYLQMAVRCGIFASALVVSRSKFPQFESLGLTMALVLTFLGTLIIETIVSIVIIRHEKPR